MGYAEIMPADFAEAKAMRDVIQAEVYAAATALNAIPGVGSGRFGLTPDTVRETPEYREARARSMRAFEKLRAFNTVFVRAFKKQISEEHRPKVG